ncbi:hypothetical protein L3X38_032756 [Prunus dulcis]|uniref:Uncharacterized protein n=1 Tax=Prunus dulcis TaxID=3755 RepID=A0AAD4VEL5_PRUDU|nr:hypothetical protein L3X38_032756 [Prunus dulcis]
MRINLGPRGSPKQCPRAATGSGSASVSRTIPVMENLQTASHTPDRLRRSAILSALGLATFSPARTVLFLGAHEATSQGGHPSWDCSSLQLA